MIKEFEFYHGVVFSKLIHNIPEGISIKLYPSPSNASYVINDNIGIYIKHSTKRMSPWRFSFQKCHQDEIFDMQKGLNNVFVLLVCGEDGVVALSYEELKTILDYTHDEIEWISASRTRNKDYEIKGSDGKLEKKIGKIDFLKKLSDSISQK
ncbi:hypothetical protein [Elizabethkingia anophelis]|uniref:hypothetical protein n=1 Tax=Elizabethkingia anophelis TaxID=1117645 RepID=UPI0038920537